MMGINIEEPLSLTQKKKKLGNFRKFLFEMYSFYEIKYRDIIYTY